MAHNPRLEDLRRRLQRDPASIAFAQLAEELRRGGEFEEAVRIARAGLEQHPSYLSARVTLGRSLMEVGRLKEAQAEFERVLQDAPDHLTALRSMADLHQRHRQSAAAERRAPLQHREPPPLPPEPGPFAKPVEDGQLAELEGWLANILSARASA